MFCGGSWLIGGIGACHVIEMYTCMYYIFQELSKKPTMFVLFKGGSGAPVKYKGVVIGLVSFVSGYCTTTLKPDVYAKISSVIPWIKTITGIP